MMEYDISVQVTQFQGVKGNSKRSCKKVESQIDERDIRLIYCGIKEYTIV